MQLHFHRFLVVILVLLVMTVGCWNSAPSTGDNYPPVTSQQLVNATYNHRTGRDEPKLDWSFTNTKTTIRTLEDKLPEDLISAFEEPTSGVQELTAQWILQGEDLILSSVQLDERELNREVTVRAFNTGVLRIEVNGIQYVFR